MYIKKSLLLHQMQNLFYYEGSPDIPKHIFENQTSFIQNYEGFNDSVNFMKTGEERSDKTLIFCIVEYNQDCKAKYKKPE